MKRVLVTGANGFVGSNVVKILMEEGLTVRGLVRESSNLFNLEGLDLELVEGDVRNIESLKEALEGCDGLIHTAALYSFWAPDPSLFYRVNVEGTVNVLKAASDQGVQRAVVTGTASYLKSSEEGCRRPLEDSLSTDYRRTKCIAEKKAFQFEEENALSVTVASPTVPIGPGDIGPTPTGRMIRDFLLGKMNGYLDMSFNVIDVEDVARGHFMALSEGESGSRYVLGYRNTSLSKLMDLLSKFTGKPRPRFRSPYPLAKAAAWMDELVEGKVMNRHPAVPLQAVLSTRKDERIDTGNLAWDLCPPKITMTESLRRAVDWFRENDDAVGGR